MARELAESARFGRPPVVLFTSGYLPLACLAPLRRMGCAVGRMHPLAPIPTGQELSSLSMAPFALEGDARALRAAQQIVAGIQGIPLRLKPGVGAAQAYHAGASLMSGGLVALFHLAERVMTGSVSSRVALREALTDFGNTTLWNVWCLGPTKALTGAFSRGSEPLVRGHLSALRRVPEAHALYRLLGRTMLELAHARGSVDDTTKGRLLVYTGAKGARREHRRVLTSKRARRLKRAADRSG